MSQKIIVDKHKSTPANISELLPLLRLLANVRLTKESIEGTNPLGVLLTEHRCASIAANNAVRLIGNQGLGNPMLQRAYDSTPYHRVEYIGSWGTQSSDISATALASMTGILDGAFLKPNTLRGIISREEYMEMLTNQRTIDVLGKLEAYIIYRLQTADFPTIAVPTLYNDTVLEITANAANGNFNQMVYTWINNSYPTYGQTANIAGNINIGDFPLGFIHEFTHLNQTSLLPAINKYADHIRNDLGTYDSNERPGDFGTKDFIYFIDPVIRAQLEGTHDNPGTPHTDIRKTLKGDIYNTQYMTPNILPLYKQQANVVYKSTNTTGSYTFATQPPLDQSTRWTGGLILSVQSITQGNYNSSNICFNCTIATPAASRPSSTSTNGIFISRYVPLILQIPAAHFYSRNKSDNWSNLGLQSVIGGYSSSDKRPMSLFINNDMVYLQVCTVFDYQIATTLAITATVGIEVHPSNIRPYNQLSSFTNSNSNTSNQVRITFYDPYTLSPIVKNTSFAEDPLSEYQTIAPNLPQNFTSVAACNGYWADMPNVNITTPFLATQFTTVANSGASNPTSLKLQNTPYGQFSYIIGVHKKAIALRLLEEQHDSNLPYERIYYDGDPTAKENEQYIPLNIKKDESGLELSIYAKVMMAVAKGWGFCVPIFKPLTGGRSYLTLSADEGSKDKEENQYYLPLSKLTKQDIDALRKHPEFKFRIPEKLNDIKNKPASNDYELSLNKKEFASLMEEIKNYGLSKNASDLLSSLKPEDIASRK